MGFAVVGPLALSVGVMDEGLDRTPADEFVDGRGLARPIVEELELACRIRLGLPSLAIWNWVTKVVPITCSGGMP